MPKNNIDKNNITSKYKSIYNFFFKYLIYFIIATIGLAIIIKNFNKKEILELNNNFMIEKVKLIGEFNKKLNQQIENKDIKIHITNGSLESNSELLLSVDNLVLYKGFVLPKNIFIYQTSPIKNIEYFDNENYEIKELENLIRNTIFTNLETIDKTSKNNISLPINESIENTFYTKCIKKNKIFNKTCDHYTKNFINTFFIYNINKDYNGLKIIFELLEKTKYKQDACEGIKKYIIYSKDTDNELEQIFKKCGKNYLDTFKDLKIFLEIQDQLRNGYINSSIYENKNLNTYKLLSYQQLIYNDLNQNTIDTIRFESYFNYLKNILKNDSKIDKIYFDITYRLNNNYILSILNKNKYKVSERKKTEIENTIKGLNTINNGSNLEGYKGLKSMISNKNLEKIGQNNQLTEQDEGSEMTILLENLKSLSFLKILNEKLTEDKIKISGYFSIKTKEGIISLYLGFIADKDGSIESININEYEDLNQTVGNIIKQKKYTITEIYQYIQNNINIFLSKDVLSTCEIIKNKLKDFSEKNKKINYINLIDCNEGNINIIKEEKIEENNIKFYYDITLENFNISDIKISDKDLENELRNYLDNINTNHVTIPNIVQEIISYKKQETNLKQEGSNKTKITIEDFEKHLLTIPSNISESGGQIFVEFSIKNIKFVGTYNTENKILEQLHFQYNIQNDSEIENKIKKEDLFIENFKIQLKDDNQNEINRFLADPLDHINNTNPNTVNNYKKLKYK